MKTPITPDVAIENIARLLCDDVAARKIARELDAPCFDDSSSEVKSYWLALASLSIPTVPEAGQDLEHKLRMIVSHATGGNCQDISLSTNHLSVLITKHVNRVYQAGKDAAPTPSPARVAIERARDLRDSARWLVDRSSHHGTQTVVDQDHIDALRDAVNAYDSALSSTTWQGIEGEILDDIANMMTEFVDNWPNPKKVSTALALIAKTMRAALNPPKHKFWGAGEADCPRDIKAGNGELHTLRCKVCCRDNPRDDRCLPAPPTEPER